ncbi:hypothetical protein CC78DRAFT_581903 [Lojkania enalia]|uniref:Uncharacterized protein n=1 Tax=Lojkania enalia TaxID=147567 RepID=A0A9P4N235_9PLEO|nr:hypothetical protein CC78DRAFT_581903 [Didymosphaeria enalia]
MRSAVASHMTFFLFRQSRRLPLLLSPGIAYSFLSSSPDHRASSTVASIEPPCAFHSRDPEIGVSTAIPARHPTSSASTRALEDYRSCPRPLAQQRLANPSIPNLLETPFAKPSIRLAIPRPPGHNNGQGAKACVVRRWHVQAILGCSSSDLGDKCVASTERTGTADGHPSRPRPSTMGAYLRNRIAHTPIPPWKEDNSMVFPPRTGDGHRAAHVARDGCYASHVLLRLHSYCSCILIPRNSSSRYTDLP